MAIGMVIGGMLQAGCSDSAASRYPASRQLAQVDHYHGVAVADPYRWLEDDNSSETRQWVQAQQQFTEQQLAAIPGRQALHQRIAALWHSERRDLPLERGGRTFYFRHDGVQSQPVLYVRDHAQAEPRVLLDANSLSGDGRVALTAIDVSPDGKRLAYGVSESGSDWQTWRFLSVADGRQLRDELRWVKFSKAVWNHEGSGVYYSRFDAPAEGAELQQINYFHKLYYHALGTEQAQDQLIYERPDQREWGFYPQLSDDGQYLLITVSQGTDTRNRLFYKDLKNNGKVVELISELQAEYQFIGNQGSRFFIKTSLNAPNGRIVALDVNAPQTLQQVVPETSQVIDEALLVGDTLVINYMVDVVSQLQLFHSDGTAAGKLVMPGQGRVSALAASADKQQLYYSYSSYLQPPSVYQAELKTLAQRPWFSPQLTFNAQNFVSEQRFYYSKDGTRVPIMLLYRKGLPRDGRNPTILYGYGGFNIAVTPRYSPAIIAWLELGGIYAVANLRGGGEYGEAWHQAGMLANKQNVFDDFIAAAEFLIAEGYSQPAKLAISGRSNGGLLVGAAMTQRPELFAAAAPAVGVLDMLRFHKFTIGWAWASEYGSADDPAQFKTLLAYSPLHNLKPGNYPATLVMTADHDDRVVPAHSFKFTAALQAAQQGAAPIMARIESNAGHGAGKATALQIAEWSDMFAFMLNAMGEQQRLLAD